MNNGFVWDRVVRASHWLVALCVLLNLTITEEGESLHQFLGYGAAALVLIRLLWALSFAKKPARFCDLIPSPKAFYEHFQALATRQKESQLGHNPFGLLAIWSMWLCIFALAVSGYLSETDWGIMNDVSEVHEVFAGLLQVVVILHISAVFIMGWWFKHSFIQAMLRRPSD